MPAFARPPIPVVVMQHAQESATLRHVRSVLVRAPHVRLLQLQRLDERIAAHLDGLAVAGSFGTECCTAALETPGTGEVFAAAVVAIESRDAAALERLVALAGAQAPARRGLLSALGWVSAAQLKGIVSPLLVAADPVRKALGLGACRLHQADPGATLAAALGEGAAAVRAEAARCAGALGRSALLPRLLDAMADADPQLQFEAAWAACLLGDRGSALDRLAAIAQGDSPRADDALAGLLLAADFSRAQGLVRQLAQGGRETLARRRRLVRACGLLGDTHFVPWLIDQMADDTLARLAGEAFSLVTGADLAALDLERRPPEGLETGPNDDPEDENVGLDEDDSLPWPDQAKLQRWWHARAAALPAGRRCFMGAPPATEPLARVLREGFQRQRIVAAQWQGLLAPGAGLFATAAPAWRQLRRVAAAPVGAAA
jgi:uncharacterized protein (TIGR02270 family)